MSGGLRTARTRIKEWSNKRYPWDRKIIWLQREGEEDLDIKLRILHRDARTGVIEEEDIYPASKKEAQTYWMAFRKGNS